MTSLTKRQLRRRKGGIETIGALNGVGRLTMYALNRNGYKTLNQLAKADLDRLENIAVGTHRIRMGREKAKKLKRQAARAA